MNHTLQEIVMRYTKKDVLNSAQALARAKGKTLATNGSPAVGDWYLDHDPTWGGYKIAEELENGGLRYPLGETSHKARQFCECVSFALNVLRAD